MRVVIRSAEIVDLGLGGQRDHPGRQHGEAMLTARTAHARPLRRNPIRRKLETSFAARALNDDGAQRPPPWAETATPTLGSSAGLEVEFGLRTSGLEPRGCAGLTDPTEREILSTVPVTIKRYANRKLYDTEASRYITLRDISDMVRLGREIHVIDNATGHDISSLVLSQVLVDDQKKAPTAEEAPIAEVIQRQVAALYALLRRSMGDVTGNFSGVKENLSGVKDNVLRWVHTFDSAEREQLGTTIAQAVDQALDRRDLPTRADLETLNKNIDRLATALEALERDSG